MQTGDTHLKLCNHQLISTQLLDQYRVISLKTVFEVDTPVLHSHFRTHFESIVGSIAGDVWINDATLNFAIRTLVRSREDCFVLDSLMFGYKTVNLPRPRLSSLELVLFPSNLGCYHWSLIAVSVLTVAELYDPMANEHHLRNLMAQYQDWVLPYLQMWFRRDEGTTLPTLHNHIASSPRQHDGFSCGR